MSDRMFVGTRKGLFAFERKGAGWSIAHAAFLGDNVTMLLPDARDGSLYAAIGHGHFGAKLHRSEDGGKNWTEIASPVYPEPPKDAERDIDPMRGTAIPWTLDMIWSLEIGGIDQDGSLWCGTLPGGLFRSRDRGATWEINRPLWEHPARKKWTGGGYDLPGIHSICVDPRNSKHVTVGVSVGGVWATEDSGQSWVCRSEGMYAEYAPPESRNDPLIQDPHRVVQCPGSPDHFWSQHHNGVFKSTNNCGMWEDVPNAKPSKFGFGVVVHPKDGNTAWLAPAIKDEKRIPVDGKVVVARTRDGGQSFEVLRNGLPQEHAYDLVFRHALEIDDSGDRLAMGSTTGALWTTNNQGDDWQLLNAHLPPIHVIRFA